MRSTPLSPALLVSAALGLLLTLSSCAQARELPGLPATVLSVRDGDSLWVRLHGQRRTVRLACIDAPELDQAPHGAASRAYLRTRLPPGTPVRLLQHDTDRHGRLVAEVIGDINYNLALVEDGQAFVYPRHVHQCDEREFRAAEFRASRHRHGIWQEPGGITRPWDHRRDRRRETGDRRS